MKKGQGNPSRRAALFGGTGEVLVWDLLGSTPIPPFTAALACELEAGGSVGAHVQQEFAEIVIVTEGRGVASVNGAEQPIEPGSVVALPLGKVLALRNGSSEEPLRYLIIKAVAGAAPSPPAPAAT
jgi:quercetin dioxygenase-like cupin family protein